MRANLLVLLTASALLLMGGRPAQAQSCSGTSCNGLDAGDAGCSGSATTVTWRNITLDDDTVVGTLYLRYSSTCQAVWAEVYTYATADIIHAEIDLGYGRTTFSTSYATSPMGYTSSPSSVIACTQVYSSATVLACTL